MTGTTPKPFNNHMTTMQLNVLQPYKERHGARALEISIVIGILWLKNYIHTGKKLTPTRPHNEFAKRKIPHANIALT